MTDHEQTKNKNGYMHSLSATSKAFIKYASTCHLPIVDLGCAYGIATIEAAKHGASVIACDISHEHLQILKERAESANVDSKICQLAGNFPSEVSFQNNSIDAVLASLMLAYLDIKELEFGLKKLFQALAPGGKLFIVSYSIHIKEFANLKFQTEYQKKIANGNKWPGYFTDFNEFSSMQEANSTANSVPLQLHFFDIAPLVNELESIGFEIESAEYLDGKINGAVDETWHDGREMLGIIARKPNLVM